MSHLDAAALALVALASATTAVLFALHRLRHRRQAEANGAEALPKIP